MIYKSGQSLETKAGLQKKNKTAGNTRSKLHDVRNKTETENREHWYDVQKQLKNEHLSILF